MPINYSKHGEEAVVAIDTQEYAGGMNYSSPPDMLSNEAYIIDNMYFDYSSGRLRTRYPFTRYSNSALSADKIVGITHFNNEFVYAAPGHLYYLDSSLDATDIGRLNGNGYVSFQKYGGDLCIASGGKAQEMTTSRTLTNISGSPTTAVQLYEKDGQLALVGDTSNPDSYIESAVNDKDTWPDSTIPKTSEIFTVGYRDDNLSVVGMAHAAYGHMLLFKRGRSGKSMWLLNPTENDPYARLISEWEAPHTHRAHARVANKLWIMDKEMGPMCIEGTDATEKVVINEESLNIGAKIKALWGIDESAFMVVYPPHQQVWFFPQQETDNTIWVLHYRTGSWVRFRPAGNLRFFSAYYHPNDGNLYLGGNDGYIYKYDLDNEDYQDEPGGTGTDFTQMLVSKIYDLFPYYNEEIKSPSISYKSLLDATCTIRFYSNYGYTIALDEDFTADTSAPELYEYAAIELYTKAEEELWAQNMGRKILNNNFEADNFQFSLEITAGALELHRIVAKVAKTRISGVV